MKPRVFWRRLTIEATVAVAGAMLAVWLLPARRITAWAARPPRRVQRFADPDWPLYPCLPCALAPQLMLRRRGTASALCLGVRRDEATLSAHAWVEIDGKVVVGETDQSFTRVAGYGEPQQAKAPS